MKKLLLVICLLVLNSNSLFAGSGNAAGSFMSGFERGYSMVANSGGGYRMSDEEIQIQYTQNRLTEAQNLYIQKMNLNIMEFERIRISNLRKEGQNNK